ncbi:MAG: DUF309 domain-containing protein [Thermoplasmatota archaeon]
MPLPEGIPLPEPIRRGMEAFNEGRFFEAHEIWEEHWGHGPPAERDVVLGMIKAAVALHHLNAGNVRGFAWQAEQAVPLLAANVAVFPMLDLAAFAEAIDSLAAQVRFHGHLRPPASMTYPKIERTA